MPIQDLVNKFRSLNEIDNVQYWDDVVSGYCIMHCLAMIHKGEIYHAEQCFLDGWREAVAMINYCETAEDKLIFDILGDSEPHRSLLLECNDMAYGIQYSNWKVYLTIRGK